MVLTRPASREQVSFGTFVERAHDRGECVIQPRMGFSSPALMREGLLATKAAQTTTVGTITLDSYTRLGQDDAVRAALRDGVELNGYPIVAHDPKTTRALLHGVADGTFPVQVRHGCPQPERIFKSLVEVGLRATEGGPVSYCLPYSRRPLRESARSWRASLRLLASAGEGGPAPHMETFGGCMMGQLCPPSLLVAVSLLEALFFRQHGIDSVSVSYAQQTDLEQDVEAVAALRRLAHEFLSDAQWHVVVYAYMGLYPESREGALALLAEAAQLAIRTDAERLVVKTSAEARRIPTIDENVDALELAGLVASTTPRTAAPAASDGGQIYREARALVEAAMDLSDDVGEALLGAFKRGYLDVPYCLHPDNAGRSRSRLDDNGRLVWTDTGAMPLPTGAGLSGEEQSADLLRALSYVQRKFDERGTGGRARASHRTGNAGTRGAGNMDAGTTAQGNGHLPPPQQHLADPRTRQALRLQNGVLLAARRVLADEGFVELQAPIIGPATDPGVRGAKQVEIDYYGTPYKLMTSAILYKQASLLAFDKIFCVAPNVRLEPPEASSTDRHLTEFHQIDIEMAGASRDDAMGLLETLLVRVVDQVTMQLPEVFAALGRDTSAFEPLLTEPFERVPHAEAIRTLASIGLSADAEAEIDWAGERWLSARADRPLFVTDYPTASRGFYDRERADGSGVLNNFDLLAGEGYGELVSGGEREHEHERIVSRMRQSGEDPSEYGWYLEMVRDGIPGSAGFGIGLQRLTRYLAGLDAVWQASAYPKLPKVVSP